MSFAYKGTERPFTAIASACLALADSWGEQNGHLTLLPADRANRPAPELEALVGYFLNPVALRTHLDGSLSFQQIVQRVKDTVVGAQGNAEVPTPNGAVGMPCRPWHAAHWNGCDRSDAMSKYWYH